MIFLWAHGALTSGWLTFAIINFSEPDVIPATPSIETTAAELVKGGALTMVTTPRRIILNVMSREVYDNTPVVRSNTNGNYGVLGYSTPWDTTGACNIYIPEGWMIMADVESGAAVLSRMNAVTLVHEIMHCYRGHWHRGEWKQ